MVTKALKFLAGALLVAVFATSAVAQTSIDEAERGIVRVVVILESPDGRMLYGSGSGFVVAPNLVVTAAHVVAPARDRPEYGVAIVPPEGDGLIPARIVRYSPMTELALLEFSGGPRMPPLTISTVEPHAGDGVVALGYPDVDYQGATGADLLRPAPASRTTGTIASLRDRAPTGDPIPTINHEAVISSGSSGGPLLDECGRVLGVNSWHVSGADTRETRGVATRTGQLLQFLDEAGVTPTLSDERCLSFTERAEADRTATINALQAQNQELASKLETADRLTRIAVIILIGGTLALFVAVCVLGAVLLSRRRGHVRDGGHTRIVTSAAAQARAQHQQQATAPAPIPTPPVAEPEPVPDTEVVDQPRARRGGVLAIIGGAAIAAILIVAAGVALLRARSMLPPASEQQTAFSGSIACTLDRNASAGAQGVSDMSFTASGALCVNERTLYAPLDHGRFRRVLVLGEAHAMDVLTIDPNSGEFRRERYPLSDQEFSAANQAVDSSTAGRGCSGDGASAAVTHRNSTLMRYVQGQPSQRLVWHCAVQH